MKIVDFVPLFINIAIVIVLICLEKGGKITNSQTMNFLTFANMAYLGYIIFSPMLERDFFGHYCKNSYQKNSSPKWQYTGEEQIKRGR